MSTKKLFIILVLFVCMIFASALLFAGSEKEEKAAPAEGVEEALEEVEKELPPKIFKVGMLAPLSGPLAVVGIPNDYGAKLAVDHINEDGWFVIDGQKYIIEYHRFDTRGDPKLGVAGAIKLVEEGCKIIVNWALTSYVAVQSITEPAKVILVAPGYGPEFVPFEPGLGGIKYSFPTSLTGWAGEFYRDIIAPSGKDTDRTIFTGVDKVAILTQDVAYMQFIRSDFLARNEALGGIKVVYDETLDSEMVDFSSVISAIRRADPDLFMYLNADAPNGLLIYPQMAEVGYSPQMVAWDPIVPRAPDARKIATAAANGSVEFAFFFPQFMGTPPDWAIDLLGYDPELRARYNRDVIERHGAEWDVAFTALSYDFMAGMIFNAHLSGNPEDGDAILAAIETETPFYGVMVKDVWQKETHRLINPMIWVRLRDINEDTGAFDIDVLGGAKPLDHYCDTDYDKTTWLWEVDKQINCKMPRK